MKLLSVILSGGAGTRLWPLSRQTRPKPFMEIAGSTLLEQAFARAQACGAEQTLLITNEAHFHISQTLVKQMPGAPQVHFMLEPQGRNTAPAVALAALHAQAMYGPDTPMLVLPADHLIPDTESFVLCVLEAVTMARKGHLVVFGVVPTHPDTGFGYIEVARQSKTVQGVSAFVEKPDLATAQQYLASGRHYWNSGMFCFTPKAILAAFAQHAPDILLTAQAALESSQQQMVSEGKDMVTRFEPHTFGLQPDISIDYAVMEASTNVVVVPARFGWSDVGSWPAVASAYPQDAAGNSFVADVVDIATTGTHVQVDSHGPKVVATVGLKDVIIIDTPDALLVAHKHNAQDVRRVVEVLRERHHNSTIEPTVMHRPWGTYASLKRDHGPNGGYHIKRITVKPGQSLSLQYHLQRSEHWVVVQGTGVVRIGDDSHHTEAGCYHFIPAQQQHRLSNTGKEDLVLVEVQCGSYLGEDDIVRLADDYGRV